jgi:hypothetical protein
MSQQSRSTEALSAAAANLATAERAARNINRLRRLPGSPSGGVPRDPVNLDNLNEALWHVFAITGSLGKIVTHYAHAVRTPFAGYAGSRGTHEGPADYPRSVMTAAVNAEQALTELADRIRRSAPVAVSTDALASLDIAVHNWRTKQRRAADNTGGA